MGIHSQILLSVTKQIQRITKKYLNKRLLSLFLALKVDVLGLRVILQTTDLVVVGNRNCRLILECVETYSDIMKILTISGILNKSYCRCP